MRLGLTETIDCAHMLPGHPKCGQLHGHTYTVEVVVEGKVDGGMVFNETLMQFQSDLLGVPVIRPTVAETTSLGAAYAAGLAVGFWENLEDLRQNWGIDKTWRPAMDKEKREVLYAGWKKAVQRTLDWV